MSTISSTGIGSGLDVNSIVTQLVALEKQPLKTLALKATNVQNQISSFAQIKSQISALTDVASRLALPSAWSARNATSSNTSVATITATNSTNATSFTLAVDQLAAKQSVTSAAMTSGGFVGAGTLTIALGSWAGTAFSSTAAASAKAADAALTLANADLAANPGVQSYIDAQAAAATLAAASDAPVFTSAAVIAAKAADDNAPIALNNYNIANDALTLANANLAANPGVQSYIDAQALATTTRASALVASDNAAALAAATDATDVAGLTAGASISIDVIATDTLATLAAKINKANAGVVATVFNDGTKDRLMLSSKDIGAAAGFRVQSTALTGLVFDPENSVGPSMADDDNHPVIGQDAKARINGLAVTSKTNTLTGNIPGVTVNLLATTAAGSPLTMRISEDVTPASKNVTDFVTAYNTLSANLADLTKYDGSTKAAGLFQGDSSVVGLQNVLRRMLGSTSLGATSQRLADIGIEMLKDGSLTINTTKLSVAANNGSSLQQLFTANNGDPLTNGFALKFKALGQGMLGTDGAVGSKATSLQKALDSNTAAQTKVNDKATLFETRLRARYSALDAQMAQLNALNSYVSQQVTSWNKSTG